MSETFPLPGRLIEYARQFAADGREPAVPRRASTVVLLRPASSGFEVYAISRAATMAFAAGMYAFPGGGVDPRDESVEVGWAGPAPAQWAARLGLPEAVARAVVCAAVREVFEESGVLLAGPSPDAVVGDVSGDEWEAARAALVARTVGFADLLASNGLVLRSDLLAPWARWITPEFEPRRYDTYFFLARLPRSQRARDVGGEAAHAVWAAPAALAGDGHPMLPPTRVTLRQLARYPDVDAALGAAAGRDAATPLEPRVDLDHDGGPRLVIPL
jgi:8-oxo-dGTP pyrophosphatase MutT (NUDIX family)